MSPVSGVCSRLLTFSGVALKTKSLLLFLGAGTFGLYRAAAPAQAASRRRQSPVLFMRLPACGPVCPKFHQVPASIPGAGIFLCPRQGRGAASGGPSGPRAASPEPRRPTADGVAAALPLSLGEYFYPPTRPLRGTPRPAAAPPDRGSKPQTSPSGCRLLAAAKSLANRISPAAGQGSSEKFRAPAGARPQAGGFRYGRRAGLDPKSEKETLPAKKPSLSLLRRAAYWGNGNPEGLDKKSKTASPALRPQPAQTRREPPPPWRTLFRYWQYRSGKHPAAQTQEGAASGPKPLSRGGGAAAGLPLWVVGWV